MEIISPPDNVVITLPVANLEQSVKHCCTALSYLKFRANNFIKLPQQNQLIIHDN